MVNFLFRGHPYTAYGSVVETYHGPEMRVEICDERGMLVDVRQEAASVVQVVGWWMEEQGERLKEAVEVHPLDVEPWEYNPRVEVPF